MKMRSSAAGTKMQHFCAGCAAAAAGRLHLSLEAWKAVSKPWAAAMSWSQSITGLVSAVTQAFVALVAAWERAAGWVAGAAEGTIIGLALAVAAGWEEGWSPKGSGTKLALAPELKEAHAAPQQPLPAVLAQAAVPVGSGCLATKGGGAASGQPPVQAGICRSTGEAAEEFQEREGRSKGAACWPSTLSRQQLMPVPARLPGPAHWSSRPSHPSAGFCPAFYAAHP